MKNLGFEVILFGTIIFVILFDLIKGKKNKSEGVSQLKKMKSTRNAEFKNIYKEEKSSFSFV